MAHRSSRILVAVVVAAAGLHGGVAGAATFSESVSGDFSSDRLNPTLWTLSGSSTPGIRGTHYPNWV